MNDVSEKQRGHMRQIVPNEQEEATTNRIIAYLRRSPGMRAALYLGSAATLSEVFSRLIDWDQPYALERLHLTLMPFVAALTYGFTRLSPQNRAKWTQHSVQHQVVRAAQGGGLGAVGILSFFAIAAARDWLSAPAWGWEHTAPSIVGRAVALRAIGQLAVAWNEEVVFRGYGYDALCLVLPKPVAAAVITALFAYAHAPGLLVKIFEAELGLTLLLLREASDGIAAPIGYHWAWNFLQSGFFGPADSTPSLRPVLNHGPHQWVGRPGYVDPGYLAIAVALATTIGMWVYKQKRERVR